MGTERIAKLFDDHVDFTPVRGTYVFPLRVFSERPLLDPEAYLEVIRVIRIEPFEILVTRGGGLFVPEFYSTKGNDLERYGEEIAACFNKLLCELTLLGFFTEPISAVHIQPAKMLDGIAAVFGGGGGGRAYFAERGMGPLMLLVAPETYRRWLPTAYWNYGYAETLLDEAKSLRRTSVLLGVATSVPSLIVGAYYYFMRRQESEAVITSWLVVEQILNFWWDQHVNTLQMSDRRQRLQDARTYTASVRAEILHTVGLLTADVYDAIQLARKHRNNLAHRVRVDIEAAGHCMGTLQIVIEQICGVEVAVPTVWRGWAGPNPRPLKTK